MIIRVAVNIAASPEVCFDLARSVDARLASAWATGEQAVAGVTTGLLRLGDQVTWRGRHFGVMQELTSRITTFDRPRHFRDEMVRGAFARLRHDQGAMTITWVAGGAATLTGWLVPAFAAVCRI